jgi:hypothetical protein
MRPAFAEFSSRLYLVLIFLTMMLGAPHRAAGQASGPKYTVTVMPESSGTYPAGYANPGFGLPSQTADPLGPFSDEPVWYLGWQEGGSGETLNGSHLIYRFRLDFDQSVKVTSVTEDGLGDRVTCGSSFLRLLDKNENVIATLSTFGLPEALLSYTLNANGPAGQTFFVDEFDCSTVGRYRDHIGISFTAAGCQGLNASAPGGTTIDFTDRAAFNSATNNLTTIGFGGILPPAVRFGGYGQLDVPAACFSTPISGTFVNITTANYYSPNVYPQDFIVDSVNQNTGKVNANNELVVTLTRPTLALGLDLGGLGFSGASSGTVTLSNGHSLTIPSLPTVGKTTFVGFSSTVPITSFTFATTNDSWVLEDILLASPIVPNCAFTLLPNGAAFQASGGLGSFTVNTGPGCTWSPTFNVSWLSEIPSLIPLFVLPGGGPANGVGPGEVTFAVASNTGAARFGSISVGGRQFNVDQSGGSPCTFSISPNFGAFDASGEDERVIVTTANGCAWTTTSNAGWLSITSSASGTGNAAVVLHAAPNTGGARSGTVTIAGQTFTATQAAPAPTSCGAKELIGSGLVRVSLGAPIPVPGLGPNAYTEKITVVNQSGTVLHAPLFLVLVGVPNHRPDPFYKSDVYGAQQTTCFTPAGDAMFQITTGDLPPGGSVAIDPIFVRDPFTCLCFTPKVLSGPPSK